MCFAHEIALVKFLLKFDCTILRFGDRLHGADHATRRAAKCRLARTNGGFERSRLKHCLPAGEYPLPRQVGRIHVERKTRFMLPWVAKMLFQSTRPSAGRDLRRTHVALVGITVSIRTRPRTRLPPVA